MVTLRYSAGGALVGLSFVLASQTAAMPILDVKTAGLTPSQVRAPGRS